MHKAVPWGSMVTKVEKSKRHFADFGWLKSFYLFSFADYYDPLNMGMGALRVFNDDTIAPKSGFGAHSHADMEIVTIVLAGELTHQDSMGNTGVIKAGEVQYMSAGTGVTHAEMNTGDEPVRLYQIWILPDEKGLVPLYEQKDFSRLSEKNTLRAVVSGTALSGALHLRTNASIYTSHLEAHHSITHLHQPEHPVLVYLRKGKLEVNRVVIEAGDQARVTSEPRMTINALEDSEFILIDVIP